MANGAYKQTRGKNYDYPKYLRKNEVDPKWVGDFINTLPEEAGQQYLNDLGLLDYTNVSNIRKEFDAGRLKMFAGMSSDKYNAYGNRDPNADFQDYSQTSGAMYLPRSAPDDTARIMINPKITGMQTDAVPHEFWHELVGHKADGQPWNEGRVPKLSIYDKLDKASRGRLPFGNYPTDRQAINKYGDDAPTFLDQIYKHDYHPKTTDIEFEKNIGDPWLENLSPEIRDQIQWQEFPMKHGNDTQTRSNENPLLAGTVKKDGDVIKSVRGWIKNTVPWMKRGEGLIPDDIYKQGSWFGSKTPYDPNNPIIQAGEKLGGTIY